MSTFFAFLRGINVGGNNKIPMVDLRKMFEELKMKEVKTILQSGNVAFQCTGRKAAELEEILEKETTKRFGGSIAYMVRSADELSAIVKDNPFPKEAKEDPSHLLVLFLKESATNDAEQKLNEAIKGREVVKVSGRNAYAIFPDGIGTSKVTPSMIDKNLGTRSTARNWNTVNKLLALAAGEKD